MRTFALMAALLLGDAMAAQPETVRLETRSMVVEIEEQTGRWSLTDMRSGVRWPSEGTAGAASAQALQGGFATRQASRNAVVLTKQSGATVTFALVDRGRSLEIRYGFDGDLTALADALAITNTDRGYAILPCREGLLIPADSGKSFKRTFGTSDYEGCHMNMIGLVKAESALLVTWDDAYVFPEVQSVCPKAGPARQLLTTSLRLRRSARALRVTPLGKGDANTIAGGYRRIAEQKGFAATLRKKIDRNRDAERMVGASNVKLWTCLARRMNEESTAVESETIRWTFDEAAKIAEHLDRDLKIDRCLFMMGGWTEGGYDVRHPDALPANRECGGNRGLADAMRRIEKLGYLSCLHDNYQDMYRDAKSWDPALIEKDANGNLLKGGRWLGGRAYMVCAPNQLMLASRPQNLPAIEKLFHPRSYFIDTTYAVGPRECHDPNHPIGRNDDIAWKARLSDYAREAIGLFGSECGREWALPHSDFFEGLVGVSGRYYHGLDPASLGATVIPFFEMVYHDCQIAWGKYGYAGDAAAEYVAHHVLCARPLHYHSIPDHLYWTEKPTGNAVVDVRPRVSQFEPTGKRSFRIGYTWGVAADVAQEKRAFVHFVAGEKILFQDDHTPQPPTSSWCKGNTVEIAPHEVTIPPSVRSREVTVYIGLFDVTGTGGRVRLQGSDSQQRVLLGTLHIEPELRFEAAARTRGADTACYARSDGGWAEGMHPVDVFLKNTHEVLGPLHAATAHERLTRFEFLNPERTLRRATYGRTVVVVNFGATDATVRTKHGGDVVLPPYGFAVEGPTLIAFHARAWGSGTYGNGALFAVRAPKGKTLDSAASARVYHGFGEATIALRGREYDVPRERLVRLP